MGDNRKRKKVFRRGKIISSGKGFQIMRKFILCLLFLLSFGFSQDKDMQAINISLTLQEEEALTPDVLKVDISINAHGNKEADVVGMLGEIDRTIRSLGLEYSGGNYWVQKNCWWEEGKRKCKGYLGELRYSFRLQRAWDQNRLLDALDGLKEKFGEAINYAISQTIWIVSEIKIRDLEERLRLRLLDRAKDFATKVSKKLGKECHIQNVNYEYVSPIRGGRDFMALKSSQAPEPRMEDIFISVRAVVGFVCR